MKRFDDSMLVGLRSIPVLEVLVSLSAQGSLLYRIDTEFRAIDNPATRRVFVSVPSGMSWEFVVTGVRWFDTRAQRGGGGAIDLWMHMSGQSFGSATRIMSRALAGRF